MSARRTFLVGGAAIAVSVALCLAVVARITAAAPAAASSSRAGVEQLPAQAAIAPARSLPLAAPAPPAPEPAARTEPDSSPAPPPAPAGAAAAPDALRVSFRLDPRLTKGLHMGDRWISPPTYVGAQSGGVFTVDARTLGAADGDEARGPTWIAAEPDMVAVSPDRGSRVAITVLRPGESTLTVSEGDRLAALTVKAVQRDGVWRVDISQ